MSHQVSSLNTLRDQVQTLKEENESLKKLNFSAKEKENLETQLAKAQSKLLSTRTKKSKSTKSFRKPMT